MMMVRALLATYAMLLLGVVRAGAEGVSLSTSSPCYASEEPVTFILRNDRPTAIHMPNSPVWRVIAIETNAHVYPLIVSPSFVHVGGHSSLTYAWPQLGLDGNPVGDGRYRVEVRYSEELDPLVYTTVAATFEIDGRCPITGVDRKLWSGIKRQYR